MDFIFFVIFKEDEITFFHKTIFYSINLDQSSHLTNETVVMIRIDPVNSLMEILLDDEHLKTVSIPKY